MPLFIAFEGGEGSGKSTQVKLLADWLTGQGQPVFATYEPGATSVGKAIRSLLLETDEQITPRSEALLFAADRAHHVETELRPMLADGRHVLCDRYIDSSIAYQGFARGLDIEEVTRTSRWATGGLLPQLTLVLDLPAEDGLRRARGRSGRADRLEAEAIDFHERVRAGFLELAKADPARYAVIAATGAPDQVADAVRAAVFALLGISEEA
jgi:dTMP kinase